MKNLKATRGSHGGRRSGSGQKPGKPQRRTIEKRLALDVWKTRVEAELDALITAQLELAKGAFSLFGKDQATGAWMHVTDPALILKLLKSGEEFYRVMQKEPDGRMLKDIMDRLTGKPKEQLELTGAGGGPVQVRFVDA